MSETTVRWATRWDRKVLVEMQTALAAQHDAITDEEALSYAFDYALSNPDRVRFIVAQVDSEIVGMISLHDAYSTWQARPYGVVHDVYVHPDHRGHKVGSALLAVAVEEALKRGYCRLEVQVQEDNESALHFYEANEYRFTGYLVYSRETPPEAG